MKGIKFLFGVPVYSFPITFVRVTVHMEPWELPVEDRCFFQHHHSCCKDFLPLDGAHRQVSVQDHTNHKVNNHNTDTVNVTKVMSVDTVVIIASVKTVVEKVCVQCLMETDLIQSFFPNLTVSVVVIIIRVMAVIISTELWRVWNTLSCLWTSSL